MEPTFKIILDKRREKKNLKYPLKLRVYQNRAYKEHSLRIFILEEDWDEKLQEVKPSDNNSSLYNTKIISVKTKIRKKILFNEDEERVITPDEIIEQISRKNQIKIVTQKPDILEYGKKVVSNLKKAGNIGNSIVYECAIAKLQSYSQKDKLLFENLDYSFLQEFNSNLLSEGIKVNSISNYLRTIRALFNKAIKEGIIDAKLYPFSTFKIKNERTINRTLTIEELKKLIAVELPIDSKVWHYQNLFLLSFCLIGMNFADLLTLRPEDIIDGRVVFHRKKTRKIYSIKIPDEAAKRFKVYADINEQNNKGFILPFVKEIKNLVNLKKEIGLIISNTNDNLKRLALQVEIKKKISTYYARYTWANIAKSLGYSKDMIAEALGHEYGNKVTGIYLDNYDNEVIDEMNEKVISALF